MFLTGRLSLSTERRYSKLIIMLVCMSSVIQCLFGYGRNAPTVFKMVIALLLWVALGYAYRLSYCIRKWPKMAQVLFILLFANVGLAFVYTFLFGTVLAGNKYVVLTTNLYTSFNVINILFVFALTSIRSLKYLGKAMYWYIPLTFLCTLVNFTKVTHGYSLSYLLVFCFLLYPYVSKRLRLWLGIGALASLLCFLGGGRQVLLSFVLALLAWQAPRFFSKKLLLIGCVILLVMPLAYVYLYDQVGSLFKILSKSVSENDGMNTDTRTFLYVEFAEDFLMQRNLFQQLFGKGCVAYYFSQYFFENDIDGVDGMRICNEVPVLQYISQCGVVYFLLFSSLIVVAIKRLYSLGRSRMTSTAMILIAAYYFSCYVSNYNGCSLLHLGFWMLIGIAFNDKLLKMSDKEIRLVLKKC